MAVITLVKSYVLYLMSTCCINSVALDISIEEHLFLCLFFVDIKELFSYPDWIYFSTFRTLCPSSGVTYGPPVVCRTYVKVIPVLMRIKLPQNVAAVARAERERERDAKHGSQANSQGNYQNRWR